MEAQKKQDQYIWCVQCMRTYPIRHWRVNGWGCPTDDCVKVITDGNLFWEDVREVNTGYPEIPETGGFYPLGPDQIQKTGN